LAPFFIDAALQRQEALYCQPLPAVHSVKPGIFPPSLRSLTSRSTMVGEASGSRWAVSGVEEVAWVERS